LAGPVAPAARAGDAPVPSGGTRGWGLWLCHPAGRPARARRLSSSCIPAVQFYCAPEPRGAAADRVRHAWPGFMVKAPPYPGVRPMQSPPQSSGGQPVGSGRIAGRVAGLWRYPVKSMAAEVLAEADVSWHGLAGDRRWAFIRDGMAHSGTPWLTTRHCLQMAHFRPSFVDPDRPDASPASCTPRPVRSST
jgi:hypothetical protein